MAAPQATPGRAGLDAPACSAVPHKSECPGDTGHYRKALNKAVSILSAVDRFVSIELVLTLVTFDAGLLTGLLLIGGR